MRVKNNRGAAALEAAIGVTLFLFVSLLLFHALHFHAVKTVVYEAAAEAAEYAAELAYLEEVAEDALSGEKKDGRSPSLVGSGVLLGAAEMKLLSSLDETELVDHYVVGGKAGILLLGSEFPDENGDILLRVTYTIEIDTPMLPALTWVMQEEIHQKPYLGHDEDGEGGDEDDEDEYVYVTDNREVYHIRRNCTHLTLKIRPGTKQEALAAGYHSCEYCGKDAGNAVLICPEGEAYHSKSSCRGLRRTVHRVKKSEVAGLPPCSRCGR